MLKNKTFTFLFIIFFIMCYYGWIFVFFQDNSMREFGSTFFPFIGTFISIIWLSKTLPVLVTEHKRFVLILILGLLLFLFSNIISLSTQVLDYHYRYVNISSYIWLISYLVVFISLIYKLKLLYKSNSMGPFFFNIVIFMIAATTVSIHYFINPTIKLSIEQQSSVFLNTLFPIINLGIIFVTINIFVMTRHTKDKVIFFFLSLGFVIHSAADAIYVFQLMNNQYLGGILVSPLWTLAILLIGFSAFFVEELKEEKVWTFHSRTVPVDNGLLLNLSVIFLAALVMEETSWNWTILSVGLILSIVAIVIRQIIVIKNNRKLLENLSYHAYYDKLTGILNRASFRKETADIIRFSKERNNKFAIMLIDFDRFKNINDTLGHDVGDELLRECALKLKATISKFDRVYRMGGDEFILIIQNISKKYCTSVAEEILIRFSKPIQVFNYQISITPSIGISFYPDNGETLLKNADTSMYLAKSNGRNQFALYSNELNYMMQRKMQLETDLNMAIENGSLSLHYQPKVDLQTRKIVGFEALLRWKHPTYGNIPPDEFIPIAEDTGQIVQIGDWVLYMTCKQLKQLQQIGYENLVMCVNVSVKQFQHKEFLSNVKKITEQTGVKPTNIILEITESIIKNLVDSKRILQELKIFGIKTSLDDFGTGYSSLSVLKTLPINAIKIDKTFIQNNTDKDNAILKTIMDLGYNLNLNVVIEGIESEEQINPLLESSNRNTFGQGFLFSKPVPSNMLKSLLEKKTL